MDSISGDSSSWQQKPIQFAGDLRRSADVLADVAGRSGSGATPDIAARALAEETGALEARLSEIRASEAALDSVVS